MMNGLPSFKGKLASIMSILVFVSIFSYSSYVYGDGQLTETEELDSLTVALYPYVPDLERFEKAVADEWATAQPDVTLNFVDWDGYSSDPYDDLDVFVFDAIFLSHFIEEDHLMPLTLDEVDESSDILPFALDGVTVNDHVYAIPQIVCTNLLYTRAGDSLLSEVSSVPELYQEIGPRQSSGIIPNPNEGLLISMSGSTTKVLMYLDALLDTKGVYNDYDVLPELTHLNRSALNSLVLLQRMAGPQQSNYWPDNNDPYIRAKWFEDGYGKAYIGYTEAMSSMGDFANDVNFKTISLSDKTDIPVFYGDVVGINSAITDKDKQEIAIELANVIAASDTLVDAVSTDENNPYPQYLLPARESVYDQLEGDYPIYGELKDIATHEDNKLFKMGPSARPWLQEAKPIIAEKLAEKASKNKRDYQPAIK
ncbi:thiamine pyridinylase [Salipaludibacillus sp. LMS25]|jgi:thiamine pyridinylase|uniref:thiamine pyridinylase n=1 Tax=Salipaludibacillus sp. LMS25 TaxID=2924031 RepID=UPI0020D0F439|nr:thiamine pyridinylase [Salipaludibacillus sp. LMS25]UTR14035.1 thiamine pyridinylase [Salipaludibacillus sp. LMS25]